MHPAPRGNVDKGVGVFRNLCLLRDTACFRISKHTNFFIEPILRQLLPALLVQFLRDVAEALGDRTSNTGQGVTGAAKGNGGTCPVGHPVNL